MLSEKLIFRSLDFILAFDADIYQMCSALLTMKHIQTIFNKILER